MKKKKNLKTQLKPNPGIGIPGLFGGGRIKSAKAPEEDSKEFKKK